MTAATDTTTLPMDNAATIARLEAEIARKVMLLSPEDRRLVGEIMELVVDWAIRRVRRGDTAMIIDEKGMRTANPVPFSTLPTKPRTCGRWRMR